MADPSRPTRPTGWIVLTGALLAAVVGLAIWAAVLQSDQDDVDAANAAHIQELEQEVADLEQQLNDQEAAAESAAGDAQAELDDARSQLEASSAELAAKGEALEEGSAELARLAEEAEAALADAEDATATAREQTRAQRARAELAEACLATVGDILQRLYASDETAEALDQAAAELEEISEECAPAG